jgi:hypothetical protein
MIFQECAMHARSVAALFLSLSLLACKGPQATTEELAEGSAAVVAAPGEGSAAQTEEGTGAAEEASAPAEAEEASTAEVMQDADAGYGGDANPLVANPGARNGLATSPQLRPRLQLNTVRPGGLRPRLDNVQLQPYRQSVSGSGRANGSMSPSTPQRTMGPTNEQPIVERRGQVQ